MTENQSGRNHPAVEPQPVPAGQPEAQTAAETAAEAAGAPVRRRGRVAAVGASVVLALAVAGGAVCTGVTVSGADRDAGAPVWKFPEENSATEEPPRESTGAGDGKAAASGLAAMLVPYGTTWGRGPDLGAFGSDAALSGQEATALRKESLSGLPRSQRKRLEKSIDRQRITGLAMRSYVSTTDLAPAFTGDAFTLRIELAQMGNRAAVRDIADFQSEFLDALKVLRKGPAIKGHDNARCFLPPKDADKDLETMVCSAFVGNVLVTAVADGAEPLDTEQAALLVTQQLDRISDPGKAV
ncbi:hypothetical protein AB0K80_02665 [Streptomyces sp. NPDC052682]|uniref:hypothetical protein n=1 Tax=Streptomyces sp. NPDC052682 TaxID=3154954 RepID=UPI003442EE56